MSYLGVVLFVVIFLSPLAAEHKCLEGDCTNGKGKASYPKGEVYTGEWKDGFADGRGVLEYANGEIYIGEWKNGYAEGKGVKYFLNGNLYQGDWNMSKADGIGVLYDKKGKVLQSGIWKDGKYISAINP